MAGPGLFGLGGVVPGVTGDGGGGVALPAGEFPQPLACPRGVPGLGGGGDGGGGVRARDAGGVGARGLGCVGGGGGGVPAVPAAEVTAVLVCVGRNWLGDNA